MERITRALELARLQRIQRPDEGVLRMSHPAASVLQSVDIEVDTEPAWRTPVVAVDAAHLARERILLGKQPGPLAAPYKLLRTQVLRRLEQLGANTLAIVSPRANEGKTLTAINLAISLASDPNRTTLLVDFDLRRPQIAGRFGIEAAAGVEDCLQSGVPTERALVRPDGYDRLTLLPARQSVMDSSELLGSAKAGALVDEVRGRYTNRVVLFDLAPVLEADDALAFSRHVQAALVVVSEGRTRREDVARTLELLRDTPIVGTVLNGSREQPRRPY